MTIEIGGKSDIAVSATGNLGCNLSSICLNAGSESTNLVFLELNHNLSNQIMSNRYSNLSILNKQDTESNSIEIHLDLIRSINFFDPRLVIN